MSEPLTGLSLGRCENLKRGIESGRIVAERADYIFAGASLEGKSGGSYCKTKVIGGRAAMFL
jgi:hypothetical protein